MTRLARALVLAALAAVTPGAAMAIETPRHEVERTYADFEVRRQADQIVAETTVNGERDEAGNEGFRRLAGYIFGKNRSDRKIAMTAPVTQAEGERIAMTAPVTQTPGGSGTYVVRFSMPSAYSLESLPEPLDPRVTLRVLPGRRLAVVAYRGSWSERSYAEHLEALRAAMAREGLEAAGAPEWARYDPPWIPWFMKRNEIQIPVR